MGLKKSSKNSHKKHDKKDILDLTFVLSPFSWLLTNIVIVSIVFLLFKPSISEFLLMLLVDNISAFFCIFLLSNKLFNSIFPNFNSLYPKFNIDKLQDYSTFKTLNSYPLKRALFLSILNLFKVIPGGLVIVYGWNYEYSETVQWIKFWGLQTIFYTFFLSLIYYEIHLHIEDKIRLVNISWDENIWSKHSNTVSKFEYWTTEYLSLISIFVIVFAFLVLQDITSINLAFEIIAISIASLILMSRLLFMKERVRWNLLNRIQSFSRNLSINDTNYHISLSTLPTTQVFESTLNEMVLRIRNQKDQIDQWISNEVESSKIKAIGEVSSLVAHDLSGPIHTISYIADNIENPEIAAPLKESAERASKLLQSLKNKLKNPQENLEYNYTECHVFEVLDEVIDYMVFEFRRVGLSKESFTIEKIGRPLRPFVKVGAVDLNHIFYNIFKNSVLHSVKKSQSALESTIKIEVHSDNDFFEFKISDNHNDFSDELFQKITTTNNKLSLNKEFKNSLGLRLTKSLVESLDGHIKYNDSAVDRKHFSILLPASHKEEAISAPGEDTLQI